jgi:hypothetical protein
LLFEVLILAIEDVLVLNAYQHPVCREVGKTARPEREARYVARAEKRA